MNPEKLIELAQHAASGREIKLQAGETLFVEGEAGEQMYVIAEGSLKLTIGRQTLDIEHAGGVVGEMALIDHSRRSATATALEASTLIPLGQPEFSALISRQPGFAIHIMRVQGERLRKANEVLNLF